VAANLLLFTSTWAEAICSPYRADVLRVAAELSCEVIELDIDLHPAEAQFYGVLNVPAVATAGQSDWPPIVGARSAKELLAILRSHGPED
jgi:hypothetical protein